LKHAHTILNHFTTPFIPSLSQLFICEPACYFDTRHSFLSHLTEVPTHPLSWRPSFTNWRGQVRIL